MTTSQSQPVVVCADAIRELYPDSKRGIMTFLKAVAICGPFVILATLLKMESLAVVGIALAGGTIILPLVLRVNRFIGSLTCADCSLPAGSYTTVKFIVHLKCVHCGHLSRTDCMMMGSGLPTKV